MAAGKSDKEILTLYLILRN